VNTLLTLILLGLTVKLGLLYWKKKKTFEEIETLNFQILKTNEEIKETLAIGLYHRFNKNEGELEGEQQTPLEFEQFVADVMKKFYGGETFVTPASGDFGVDIEHNRVDGRYLGQVKCKANPIIYEPIALIHSNMIKYSAKGGFVVTTSRFTKPALDYKEGLGIELIDGIKLVDYWLQGLEKDRLPPEQQSQDISA